MNDHKIAGMLIAAGCDVNLHNPSKTYGWKGETPLHNAACWGHTEIAAQLIGAKADVNSRDESGFTPLHYAAQAGSLSVVQLLIKSGAKVDVRNDEGETPLDCCRSGYDDAGEI